MKQINSHTLGLTLPKTQEPGVWVIVKFGDGSPLGWPHPSLLPSLWDLNGVENSDSPWEP